MVKHLKFFHWSSFSERSEAFSERSKALCSWKAETRKGEMIPNLAYGVKVFFGPFQFYFFFINRGERELRRGGDTHSFCPDQTLPKAESCGAVKGSRWGSRLSWSPPTCGRGGELILRCQGARRRQQVEATDALVIPVDSLLPVHACCHAGKSGAFGQFYLLLDLNQ
ncbi:hypothetical protein Tco_1527513 [Tanacetum coccineum]